MLYKHLFSILCGHLNLNQKRKKKLNWTGYQSNRPVNNQTGRYTGLTDRYTGTNRLNWEVWIWPVPTGNRPNRTGIPEPDSSGLAGPVGKVNPGDEATKVLKLWTSISEICNAMMWNSELPFMNFGNARYGLILWADTPSVCTIHKTHCLSQSGPNFSSN